MTKELINFEDNKVIDVLKKTVAKGTTPEEFYIFCEYAKSMGLNPLKKEIWAIPSRNGMQIMTGINGYYAIANRHPAFDNIELEYIRDDKGVVIACEAKVYRKDRARPTCAIAFLAEYKKDTPIWRSMPMMMLSKCAESIALRKALPQELNGTYTAEEMPPEFGPIIMQPIPPSKGTTPQPPEVLENAAEPIYYSIPEITFEQKTFLEKRGVEYDSDLGVWISPKDLGPKLAPYKLKEATIEQLAQLSKESKQEQVALPLEGEV